MLLGVLPPVIFLAGLYEAIILVGNIFRHGWKKYFHSALILVLVISYIAYNTFFAGYTAPHQLITIMPLILILVALGLENLIAILPNIYLKAGALAIIVLSLVLPLTSFAPQFWGLYSSTFVGGPNESFKLYWTGLNGEEAPAVAKYLKENTVQDSRIAVVSDDWVFKKYLEDRNFAPLLLQGGLDGAYAAGAEYVVIPRIFLEDNNKTSADFSAQKPVYGYYEKNILLANVYKLDYSLIKKNKPVVGDDGWEVRGNNNNPKINVSGGGIKVNYKFIGDFSSSKLGSSRFLLSNSNEINLDQNGMYMEIFGDSNNKIFSVILSGADKSYLEYDLTCDWKGWKKIYIPYGKFTFTSNDPLKSYPDMNQKYVLNFGVLSREQISGELRIKDIEFASH
jgi:hypothetical protein